MTLQAMPVQGAKDYWLIESVDELDELIAEMRATETICIDLETTGLDFLTCEIAGIAIGLRKDHGAYIPIKHGLGSVLMDGDLVREKLRPVLTDTSKTYVMHNVKFDWRFLMLWGITIPVECCEDSLLEVFTMADRVYPGFGLKPLTKAIFGHEQVEFKKLFPRGTKGAALDISRIVSSIAGPYACEDVDFTLQHHTRAFPLVKNRFIYQLERKLWPVTELIERTGFNADKAWLKQEGDRIEIEAQRVEQIVLDQVEQAAGHRVEFSISKPGDLREVLYDILKFPVLIRTAKTQQPATSEMALDKMAQAGYTVAKNILTVRSMQATARTLKGTLYESIKIDGRIHTSYNQSGATTGRYGSSDPNIQNIAKVKTWKVTRPDGSEYTVEVVPRNAFIADKGHYLVELDFKAIEFIIMAFLSGEESVIEAYRKGLDVHKHTASLMYRIEYDDVTEEQRDKAKMMNYLVIYGGSAFGLSMRTELTEEEAEEGIRLMQRAYPKFTRFMQKVREESRITKTVTTHFGRKQVIPEFFSTDPRAKSKALRAGVNRIVQGTAADYQKLALIKVTAAVQKRYSDWEMCKMVAQTHDSQTWSIDKSIDPREIIPWFLDAMSIEVPNFPRIEVDAAIGVTWGNMHKWGSFEKVLDTTDFNKLFEQWDKEGVANATKEAPAPQQMMLDDDAAMSLGIQADGQDLTGGNVAKIMAVLKAFPGDNKVSLYYNNKWAGAKPKTSLGQKELKDSITPFMPSATVVAKPL